MDAPVGQRRRPAPRRPRCRQRDNREPPGDRPGILVRQREQGGVADFGPTAEAGERPGGPRDDLGLTDGDWATLQFAYSYGTMDPAGGSVEAEAFRRMGAWNRQEVARRARQEELDAARRQPFPGGRCRVTLCVVKQVDCWECRWPVQQVRCKMALVSAAALASAPAASAVGRTTRSILRRRASSRTSCITGSAP